MTNILYAQYSGQIYPYVHVCHELDARDELNPHPMFARQSTATLLYTQRACRLELADRQQQHAVVGSSSKDGGAHVRTR